MKPPADETPDSGAGGLGPAPIAGGTFRLKLTADDFDTVRPSIAALLDRVGGSADRMAMRGNADSTRSLSATLRIPPHEIGAVLRELKKLGEVVDQQQDDAAPGSEFAFIELEITGN